LRAANAHAVSTTVASTTKLIPICNPVHVAWSKGRSSVKKGACPRQVCSAMRKTVPRALTPRVPDTAQPSRVRLGRNVITHANEGKTRTKASENARGWRHEPLPAQARSSARNTTACMAALSANTAATLYRNL